MSLPDGRARTDAGKKNKQLEDDLDDARDEIYDLQIELEWLRTATDLLVQHLTELLQRWSDVDGMAEYDLDERTEKRKRAQLCREETRQWLTSDVAREFLKRANLNPDRSTKAGIISKAERVLAALDGDDEGPAMW